MCGNTPRLPPLPSLCVCVFHGDGAARVNSVSDPSPPIGAVRELMAGQSSTGIDMKSQAWAPG